MDIWREGRYLDLWSVVHFLSGVVFIGWMLLFGFGVGVIFPIYLVLIIVWEIFEHKREIHEHMPNKFVDIVIGLLGFLSVFVLVDGGSQMPLYLLIVLTLVFLIMNLLGLSAYLKRPKHEL